MPRTITRDKLQVSLTKAPAPVLLEALPAKYYLDGHLPGALHFPHDRARTLAPVLVADKLAAIVVYCASDTCQNSHIAAATLEAVGYSNVRVYTGGKKDWIEAGLSVVKGGDVQLAA